MLKYLALAAFAATVPAANWLIGHMGTCISNGPCVIPVGFGLSAPSGVLMIGLALVLRDAVHSLFGVRWAIGAVLAGAALSLVFSPPHIAVASAVAFLVAELLDTAVYARLRVWSLPGAVMLSQIAGAFLDSAAFVYLAFGTIDLAAGTTLAKVYAGAAVAAWLWVRNRDHIDAIIEGRADG